MDSADATIEQILRGYRAIAVVGASRRPDTIGHQIVDNLLRHGYTGVVYPVNPGAPAVHSVRAYPTVADVPGDAAAPEPVDVGVPGEAVPEEPVDVVHVPGVLPLGVFVGGGPV